MHTPKIFNVERHSFPKVLESVKKRKRNEEETKNKKK
jgi:hypothetical protein